MHERFIEKNFKSKSLEIIGNANAIIDEYAGEGFSLTLRQLYYQFVARDLLENTERNYNSLGKIISDARLAGLIDWDAIEDRTRNVQLPSHWTSPDMIIRTAARGYRIDKWQEQPYRVEVWVEKEALAGIVEQACSDLDIGWLACRGYMSQSEQYKAGKRFEHYASFPDEQQIIVLHLGDHDPSGIDMTRDNLERLNDFSHGNARVERIALNMDQIEELKPPPNPAKNTDTRFKEYRRKYGSKSWELDALDPSVLTQLIEHHVSIYRDDDLYNKYVEQEREEREGLESIYQNYDDVIKYIEDEL